MEQEVTELTEKRKSGWMQDVLYVDETKPTNASPLPLFSPVPLKLPAIV
jgi:hypothetical protein